MRLRHRSTVIGTVVAAVAAGLLPAALSLGSQAAAGPPAAPARAAVPDPDGALGTGWSGSTDTMVIGVGDATGYHLYLARERDAFAWSPLATLNAGLPDAGQWVGEACLTGSGRYAVAVYAPATATNRQALADAGAFAAVVDTATGTARRVATGVQLTYFDPACGAGDRALLTRAVGVDEQRTDLLTVDAAAGRVTGTRRVAAQLTSPLPAADGDFGVAGGSVVRIDPTGALRKVATPGGQPYALASGGTGRLDLLTEQGDRGVAYRYDHGALAKLGAGAADRMTLFGLAGGKDLVAGDVGGVRAAPGLTVAPAADRVSGVSREGHLLALAATPQVPVDARPGASAPVRVTEQATRSGRVVTGTVPAGRQAAADTPAAPTAPRPGTVGPGARLTAAGAAVPAAVNISVPTCAVPRNAIDRQVRQPDYGQVEWAADLAVQGALTVSRNDGTTRTHEPAYTVQGTGGLFSLPSGSVRIPAQILLGVLAQESNEAQATWHAVPGDAGNPLVANYYGGGDDIDTIDYSKSDCGYGIAQDTDGMWAGQTVLDAPRQVAVATDYAANIAYAVQILTKKFTQLAAAGLTVNDGDPRYLENWYLAVWAYNSGIQPDSAHGNTTGCTPGPSCSINGNWGVGWFNNPANPRYPPRDGFLRASADDASHPQDWPYQAKVMGWAEHPQWTWSGSTMVPKYTFPAFANGGTRMLLPPRFLFCTTLNACNSSAVYPADPCPAEDSPCWWHGRTGWVNGSCATQCTQQNLAYAAGSPEPLTQATYPPDCTPFQARVGTLVGVVDDLPDSSRNLLNCAGRPYGGKFTLRTGYPPGSENSLYGQVDLHQLGAGYLGHSWFSHEYNGDDGGPTVGINSHHQVVGTWTPDLSAAGGYEVIAHIPSHGGVALDADYQVLPNGPAGGQHDCVVTQDPDGRDEWITLGWYQLSQGARVQLSNVSGAASHDGTTDIAWDAMAFVSEASPPGDPHVCNAVYSLG